MQGVGFRYFAENTARALGIRGYVRNLDDGRVEVYAIGSPEQISEFAGWLRQGPRWAEVRGVEELEAPVEKLAGFRVER